MCGITGFIAFKESIHFNHESVVKMTQPLSKRGPDHTGIELVKNEELHVALGHKRLSIIDLSESSNQPMSSVDKRVFVVFNGEIYNYKELKKELITSGNEFLTNSDTEILIQGYLRWGIDKLLNKLIGMFAFVLVDVKDKTSYLCRDRFGEKPLYYYHHPSDDTIYFSSDILSFEYIQLELTLNLSSLNYYFEELSTPLSGTIYNECKKVYPGSYVVFNTNGPQLFSYWDIVYKSVEKSTPTKDTFLESLNLAVQRTLISDVPVGTLLSGGIDSSLVTYFAQQNATEQINSFSVGFEHEQFNELEYARYASKVCGTKHNEIVLNIDDLAKIDPIIESFGEPFADSSALPTYFVCAFAKEKVKVILGGDGGDELFLGYPTYNQAKRMQWWKNNSHFAQLTSSITSLINKEKSDYLKGIIAQNSKVISSALSRGMGLERSSINRLFHFASMNQEHEYWINTSLEKGFNIEESIRYATFKTRLINDYLVKTDKMSMLNSIELRTPFLDVNLAEQTFLLNTNQLLDSKTNKYITKQIAATIFGNQFVNRPKMGFGIPIGEWMKNKWKAKIEETIFDQRLNQLLNKSEIERIWINHQNGYADNTHKIWAIYVFSKWFASKS